jgi:hypothetical protein
VYSEARRAFGKNFDSCTAGEYWRINGANKVECSAGVPTSQRRISHELKPSVHAHITYLDKNSCRRAT